MREWIEMTISLSYIWKPGKATGRRKSNWVIQGQRGAENKTRLRAVRVSGHWPSSRWDQAHWTTTASQTAYNAWVELEPEPLEPKTVVSVRHLVLDVVYVSFISTPIGLLCMMGGASITRTFSYMCIWWKSPTALRVCASCWEDNAVHGRNWWCPSSLRRSGDKRFGFW